MKTILLIARRGSILLLTSTIATTSLALAFTIPSSSLFVRNNNININNNNNPTITTNISTPRLYSSTTDQQQDVVVLTEDEKVPVVQGEGEMQGMQGMESSTDVKEEERGTKTKKAYKDDQRQQQQRESLSPAEYENSKFKCDESVLFWQNFQRSGLNSATANIREIVNVSNRFASNGADALNYWLRHNIRSGYFMTNAILGTATSTINERINSNSNTNNNKIPPENNSSFTNRLLRTDIVSRIVLETALSYEQDYKRISQSKYKLPYDMYQRNQQSSPFFALSKTRLFIKEAVGTLSRQNRNLDEDKKIWISSDDDDDENDDDATTADLYPEYYRNAFHYQTNGWMSYDSANVYDTSTETLFLGRQDAMQRTALVPLIEYSKELESSGSDSGSGSSSGRRPMKVLEVACGTGRFMTFARDNLPLDSEYTALDLSPFYLDKAREYDSQWRTLRKKRAEKENGTKNRLGNNNRSSSTSSSTSSSNNIKAASIIQSQAENLPFEDGEFDAVVCIYLFHELPRDIRGQVASEMTRVTKAGGRVILTDSTQIGDRPIFDKQMGNFEKMNEPYFRDYTEDFLPDHFEKVGMECLTKTVCSSSKSLSFRKKE